MPDIFTYKLEETHPKKGGRLAAHYYLISSMISAARS